MDILDSRQTQDKRKTRLKTEIESTKECDAASAGTCVSGDEEKAHRHTSCELCDLKNKSHEKSKCCQKPKGVSESMWRRFKAIEKRTDDVIQRSTEKRIKAIQRNAIKKVQEEITDPDDIALLSENNLMFGSSLDKGKRKRKKDGLDSMKEESESSEFDGWKDVKQYLNVNEHLECPSKDAYKRKCGLEEKIDKAIAEGDIYRAEELSSELSSREFGTKIYGAISAKKFIEEKEREMESSRAKKKKKLPWGFEAKERWETKGNL